LPADGLRRVARNSSDAFFGSTSVPQSAEGDALEARARLQALEDVLAKLQLSAGATGAAATG